MIWIKKNVLNFFASCLFLLLSSKLQAVTVLIYYNTGDAYNNPLMTNLKNLLASKPGYTVTVINSGSTLYNPSADNWNAYDQVWDMRFNNVGSSCPIAPSSGEWDYFDSNWSAKAKSYLQSCGNLYVLAENAGFGERNDGVAQFLVSIGAVGSTFTGCVSASNNGNSYYDTQQIYNLSAAGQAALGTTYGKIVTYAMGGIPIQLFNGTDFADWSGPWLNGSPTNLTRVIAGGWSGAGQMTSIGGNPCNIGKLATVWDQSMWEFNYYAGNPTEQSYTNDFYSHLADWFGAKNCSCGTPSNTPTSTPTDTPTFTPTITPSVTPSSTPSDTKTFTPSATPSPTFTGTPSNTPSSTQTATATFTPTDTPSATPSNTASDTPTFTQSDTKTATWTATPSNTQTFTYTATPSSSATATMSPSPSFTASFTPTDTSSATPTATPSDTITVGSTPTDTATPSATRTDTLTDTPSATPSDTATYTPTSSSTASPTVSFSFTDTPSFSSTPSDTPSATATPSATVTSSPSNTPSSTPTFSATPSFTPSITFTNSPSATPTFTVSPSSTASATATPTATRTATLSGTPTITRSPTPSLSPTPQPPFHVQLQIFNSAGELVADMASSQGLYQVPSGLKTLVPGFSPDQGGQGQFEILGPNQILYWNGSSSGGQWVSGGTYTLVMTVTDQFKNSSIYTSNINVIREPNTVDVEIYNSAGERVRHFEGLVTQNGSALGLSSKSFAPGSAGAGGQVMIQYGSLASEKVAWDGKNDQGQLVGSGSYLVKVFRQDGTGLLTQSIGVIQETTANPLAGSLAAPNPAMPGVNAVVIQFGGAAPNPVQGMIYNGAGEMVGQLDAIAGSRQLIWNLNHSGIASGIYLAVLQTLDQKGNLQGKVIKISIVR